MTIEQFHPGSTGFLALCLLGYGVLVNGLAGYAIAIDRNRSRSGHRPVPKHSLLLLAAFGAWPGAKLAQILLRHAPNGRLFGPLLNLSGLFLPVVLGAAFLVSDPAALQQFASNMKQNLAPFSAPGGEDAAKALPHRFGPGGDEISKN